MLQWALLEATAACPELAARPSPALLEESTPTEWQMMVLSKPVRWRRFVANR
jgi:hypothetical protein